MAKPKKELPLIAVITCDRYMARANACRKTWVTRIAGRADVKFFVGKQKREPFADEVFLDVDDGYNALPRKVQLMVNWALANGYQLVFKCDDDVFINPDNLLRELPKTPYTGHVNTTNGDESDDPEHRKFAAPTGWCSGLGYWVNKKAMGEIYHASIPQGEWAEDRWVGKLLHAVGIEPVNDEWIYPADCTPRLNAINGMTKCTCEFTPEELQKAHDGPKGWFQRAAIAAEKRRKQTEREQAKRRPMRGDGTPL